MKNIIAAFLFFFLSAGVTMAQLGINTDNTTPDPSAGLDVKFNDKGFLPPRVELTASNVAAPVTSPAAGLLVYNTATAGNPPFSVIPGYYYWDGTKWTTLVMPAGTTGQTLRNDGGNWVANDFLYNDGTKIGIGLTNPSHKLTIAGPAQSLRLIGPGDFGSEARLNFGDGSMVSLSEDIDDSFLINAWTRTAIMGGNVGIGTLTPEQKLSVYGTIQSLLGGVKFPDGTTQTTAAAGNIHHIGDSYMGGIVFYVYDGGQHGLIASTADQSTGMRWYSGTYTNTMALGDGVGAGKANTSIIIASQGFGDGATCAARLCNEYSVTIDGVKYGDWYLPSLAELFLLNEQRFVVGDLDGYTYWSSTDHASNAACGKNFGTDGYLWGLKELTFHVRAIRSF